MANISDYVAENTYIDQFVDLKAKKIAWIRAGRGSISAFSDHEVQVAGKISILGYNGDLNIHLQLTDQDPTASAGPCRLQLNSHVDDKARYEADGRMLTVYATLGDVQQNISILPCNNGEQTECKLFGHINQVVHLDPVN